MEGEFQAIDHYISNLPCSKTKVLEGICLSVITAPRHPQAMQTT